MSEETEEEIEARKKAAQRNMNAQSFLMGAFEHIYGEGKTGIKNTKYKKIIAYEDQPASLVSTFNNPDETSAFLDATSGELSLLTPRLEFYWAVYKAGQKVPIVKKFMFSDHVQGEKVLSLADMSSKDLILKGRNTIGTDVGVSQFGWVWDNKHEGDKTLKANVTLKFGSVRELLNQEYLQFIFTKNTVEETVAKWEKEAEANGNERTDKAKLANKIRNRYKNMSQPDKGTYALPFFTNFAMNKPDEQRGTSYSELKVIVGWAKPDQNVSGMRKQFLKSVESTQRTLCLGFAKYELEFGAEGQVTLKLEYVGTLDSIFSDGDKVDVLDKPQPKEPKGKKKKPAGVILPLAPEYEDTMWPMDSEMKNPYSDTAFGYSDKIPKPKAGVKILGSDRGYWGVLARQLKKGGVKDPLTNEKGFRITKHALDYEESTHRLHLEYLRQYEKGGDDDVVKKLNDGITCIRSARSRLMQRESYARHAQFITELYMSNAIKYIAVQPSSVEGSVGAARQKGAKIQLKKGMMGTASKGDMAPLVDNVKGHIDNAAVRSSVGKDVDAQEERGLKDIPHLDVTKRKGSFRSEDPRGSIRIYYFTLGELIDMAIDHLKILNTLDSRIMLGSFNGKEAGLPITSGKRSYSLADIPISVDFFGQWFLDAFSGTEPPTAQLGIRHFMNKVLNDLIAPLINSAFEDDTVESKMAFSMTTYSFPKKADAKEMTMRMARDRAQTTAIRRGQRINRLALKSVTRTGAAWSQLAQENAGTKKGAGMGTVNYLVVFATGNGKKDLRGSPTEDMKKGIYHLYVGADRGLVKSFKFKEKKMPHLRAKHIENNSQGSALIMPQDLDLTMVGNTLFKNGSLVYINADFALGYEVASRLGIGGYYLVVKSDNTIDPTKFETSLTCMYHSSPAKNHKGK